MDETLILNKKSVIIISPFTPRNFESGKGGGGMSYNSANTAEGLVKTSKDIDVYILAEYDSRFENHMDYDGYQIIRCWKRDSLFLWKDIGKQIKAIKSKYKESSVLIQFEFAAYGGFISTSLIMFLLLYLRLIKIKSVIVIHQVILNLDSLKEHLGMNNKVIIFFYSLLIKLFYIFLVLFAKQSIVFEQILKIRLLRLHLPSRKIKVIPHGLIKDIKKRNKSREELRHKYGYKPGDFVLVLFGYMAWYKGTDWLVNAVNMVTKNTSNSEYKLIIAGGPSSTQSEKKHYDSYYVSIFDNASRNKNIRITGYLPQDEIEDFFQIADLLIFPYRVLMSSSGPLSWALVYEKPFLLSEPMKDYLKTNDAKKLIGKHLTTPDQLFFKLNHLDFFKKIEFYKFNPDFKDELVEYSKALGNARVWDKLAPKYLELLFVQN